MKNITLGILTALLLLIFLPSPVSAETKPAAPAIAATTTVAAEQANILLARLDKINAMDKSLLSPVEKRQLRKEVRSIKSQLSDVGGGVYLSAGAIILIVVLLLLLL